MTKKKDNPLPTGKAARGRPTKLTPKLRDEFVSHIRRGCYIETACHLTGISKQSVFTWLKLGKNEDSRGKHRIFMDLVRKAQSETEQSLLQMVDGHAEKDWKAAAWRLERMKPKRYGPARLKVQEDEQQEDVQTVTVYLPDNGR